ncbi:S-layer homology domain-containing protein [Paenibacillus sp. KS-LC4]|uniref:S-layer homology domain-containing protein n=1 Tax=Paenibacillus sp. KS-LC4 TaxID=2979727 RepID=UPI0030CAD0FB
MNKRKWLSAACSCLLVLSMLVSAVPAYAANDQQNGNNLTGVSTAVRDDFTEQELKDNDYILYFVNAGDTTPSTVEGTDKFGLYSSVTEQVYGVDAVTGKKWGLVTTTSAARTGDASTKLGTLRYYNGSQVRDKAIEYKFELPEDSYDITFGFKNPWSGRSVNMVVNGTNLFGETAIGEYDAVKEVTYRNLRLTGNEMQVRVQGPATAGLSNYNDPMISYIIIRLNVTIPLSDLGDKLDEAKIEAADAKYTRYSIQVLNDAITNAESVFDTLSANGTDIQDPAVQEQIRSAIALLNTALAQLSLDVPNTSFKPGKVWNDTSGALIQAHGGGIIYDEHTQKYYWYGEDKTNGYLPARGVRVYSSTDLYNWEDHGLALTAIGSMDDFTNDPLISQLYAGRTDQASILNDIGTDRIIERPKVIYNDATGKYVMWMHTDGPSETSTANYAKAEAGYALSDSPTGPFVYGESHRMDRAPADAAYNGQPNQPGMARDMTLFKDDDGTAYLVYSSEENMTMYISKLNEEYTDIVGWHKDGNVERDTVYKAEYGVDYVRVFPGGQREAPALFKYQGKYYMITSGATGWDPNLGKYTVADNIFGEWKPMRDVAPGSSTTFASQSTHVLPIDPAAGKFLYMGDRWDKNDLKNSRYIWLPIEFGQNDEIALRWRDEWTLDELNAMGRITIDTPLPSQTSIGKVPALPDTVQITLSGGLQTTAAITWNATPELFAKPGIVTLKGTLSGASSKTIEHKIYVVPDRSAYFVHAGGAATADYNDMISYMEDTLINKEAIDQKYDPDNGQNWGYVGDVTSSSGTESGDLFASLRYLKSGSGDDLSYRFDIANGEYDVFVGLYDPWSQYTSGNRKAHIIINDEIKTNSYAFSAARDVLGYEDVNVTDGKLALTVRRAVNGAPDPQISWIMIVAKEQTAAQAANRLGEIAAPAQGAVQLMLPEAPEGFTVKIKSSNSAVVGTDGTITPPEQATTVQLELEVTRLSDQSSAVIVRSVIVPAKASSGGGTDTGTNPGTNPGSGSGSNSGSGSGSGSSNGSNSGTTPGTGTEPGTNPGTGTNPPAFPDVSNHWAGAAIGKLTAQGIMKGYPDGTFQPDKKMKRAEFMTIIFRLLKLDTAAGSSKFSDVSEGAWYAGSVNALVNEGIVSGFADGSFKPNQEITREEAFVILYRAIKGQLAAGTASGEGSFKDSESISAWAAEAVQALAEHGLISGYKDGSIKPEQSINRAEIATIVAKLLQEQ